VLFVYSIHKASIRPSLGRAPQVVNRVPLTLPRPRSWHLATTTAHHSRSISIPAYTLTMGRWNAGDTLVLRYIDGDGTVAQAIPTRVIEDSDRVLAIHLADGTLTKSVPEVAPEDRVAALDTLPAAADRPKLDRPWTNDTIRLHFRDEPFSVWLLFGPGWKFNWWYGNLEAPYVDTPIGIDTRDHALDVAARPDGRWWWKDEAEFARRLELGIDSPAHHARVRAAGNEVIRRLEGRAYPFRADWEHWRPQHTDPPPVLPADWDRDFGTHDLLPRTSD